MKHVLFDVEINKLLDMSLVSYVPSSPSRDATHTIKTNIDLQWQQSQPAHLERPSLLTTLAPELRTIVPENLLITPTVLRKPATSDTTVSTTNILATCEQLHSEGAHIFYTQNVFEVTGGWWGTSASIYNALIRHAHLLVDPVAWHWEYPPVTYLSLLYINNTWPKLESLLVEISKPCVDDLLQLLRWGFRHRPVPPFAPIGQHFVDLWRACENTVVGGVKLSLRVDYEMWFMGRSDGIEEKVARNFVEAGFKVCCDVESEKSFMISPAA